MPAGQRSLEATRLYDYNWFNFIENGADPAHFSILHRADPNDGTWRSWFFNFSDIPPFDAVETSYGMKVISRKPGPTADTEYVDEKSFALPSILQIGDTEFTHFKQPREALWRRFAQRASHVRHAQRRHSFTLYTVNHYTGSDPEFFHKLAPSRKVEAKRRRSLTTGASIAPFRGSVRTEDIACQGTQPLLDRRKEQLATSDKGVIMIRKIILKRYRSGARKPNTQGVLQADQEHGAGEDRFVHRRARERIS